MPVDLFANSASTTLASAVASGASTAFTLASATGFPAPVAGVSQYRAVVTNATTGAVIEYVTVTAATGTALTVTRASEDAARYPAAAIASGAVFTQVVTAGSLPPAVAAVFGTGFDGDLTVTGTVVMQKDYHFRDLIIESTGRLVPHGFRINARSVTVRAGGSIDRDGGLVNGGAGGSSDSNNQAPLLGGGGGSNFGNGSGVSRDVNGCGGSFAGGQGGTGGASNNAAVGGVSWDPKSFSLDTSSQGYENHWWLRTQGHLGGLSSQIAASATALQGSVYAGSGGSSGGAGSLGETGQSGGGAGGHLIINARSVTNLGRISANGTPGQVATNGGGGGGGGGGGVVYVNCMSYTGNQPQVNGGAGGTATGGGSSGLAGAAGSVRVWIIGA